MSEDQASAARESLRMVCLVEFAARKFLMGDPYSAPYKIKRSEIGLIWNRPLELTWDCDGSLPGTTLLESPSDLTTARNYRENEARE